MGSKGQPRLTAAQLRDWLALERAGARRLALELRRVVLRAAPRAAEGIRFRCPCYWHAGAFFGSISGNICVIEVKHGRVILSFIRGAGLPDPARLLRGNAKAKRFVPIGGMDEARDPHLARLVRAAVRSAAKDDFGFRA